MLTTKEWLQPFDDTADLIEVNGAQQLVTDQGSEPLYLACIEAVNMSGIAYVSMTDLRSLLRVLQGASIVHQGDAKIYKLVVLPTQCTALQ